MSEWLAAAELLPSAERPALWGAAAVPEDAPALIHARLLECLYSDRDRAERLATLAADFAAWRGDTLAAAFAGRCQGHLLYLNGAHAGAAAAYSNAAELFSAAGQDAEVARTLSSGLQALSYLGRYDDAHRWADRAAGIFRRLGDHLRLARLDSNVGNLLFRQDQFAEAMVRYESALAGFRALGDPRDVCSVLINMAVCRTSLGQFTAALENYREALECCIELGLDALAAQADYNIAYLYYLRGDYSEARRQYAVTRAHASSAGDAYHAALCDLDEAELALELNLTTDAAALARRAEAGFAAQGLRYEQAKALVNIAVAASQSGDSAAADRSLLRARRLFVKESNAVWPALVDQLRAVLAFHAGRFQAAQRLGTRAWRALRDTTISGRAAHSRLLLARLWLRQGNATRARAIAEDAVARLGDAVSPSLRFHANLLEGEICERQGRRADALRAYEAARRDIEDLRGRVDSEDLRISLLKDKVAVYDALCAMYLAEPGGTVNAFALAQQAKSRSLADRVGAARLAAPDPRWNELRSLYRQSSLGASLQRAGIAAPDAAEVQRRIRRLEDELRPSLSRSPASPEQFVDDLRTSLPEGAVLLEYFEARDVLYLFCLSRDELRVIPLGHCGEIRHAMRLLHFQMSKPRLGLGSGREAQDAVTRHLRELYRLLLAPAELNRLGYSHLVIAPYRHLHGLPFAALHDGDAALMDRFTISGAPSAAVFAACRRRPRRGSSRSLVLAAPDHRAPRIGEEAREVAALLGDARLLLGSEASVGAFREAAPSARIVHLAAHGEFRRDNPSFSSLRLAGGGLGVLDLQEMDLGMDLLTLSGCNTGSSVPVGADELQGLFRGFLTAGARSVVAALWEIDDAGTRDFMLILYRQIRDGARLPAALRQAMCELRSQYAHPYYWAPYVLIGDPEAL